MKENARGCRQRVPGPSGQSTGRSTIKLSCQSVMACTTSLISRVILIHLYEMMMIVEIRKQVNFTSFLPREAGSNVRIQCMSVTTPAHEPPPTPAHGTQITTHSGKIIPKSS